MPLPSLQNANILNFQNNRRNMQEILWPQEKYKVTYLFISHDLKVIKAICHDVLVMRGGVVVESGPAEDVLNSPKHEYTRLLVDAVL